MTSSCWVKHGPKACAPGERRNHRDTGRSPCWGTGEGTALGTTQGCRSGKVRVTSRWLGFGRLPTVVGKIAVWKIMPRLISLIVPGNRSFLVSLQGLSRDILNFSCQYRQWIAGNWDFCHTLLKLRWRTFLAKIKLMGFEYQSSIEVLSLFSPLNSIFTDSQSVQFRKQ